jgi:hypothetical protein
MRRAATTPRNQSPESNMRDNKVTSNCGTVRTKLGRYAVIDDGIVTDSTIPDYPRGMRVDVRMFSVGHRITDLVKEDVRPQGLHNLDPLTIAKLKHRQNGLDAMTAKREKGITIETDIDNIEPVEDNND